MALRSFAGGRLFGRATGTGPPWVLALHGWARTHADWLPVLGDLDAIALDLPGFGASPEPPAVWGGAEYAEAVATVLDGFDHPAVVVGHSRGGCVAVDLALRAPERVGALVLTGAPLLRPPSAPPSPSHRLARLAHRAGLLSDARWEARRQRSGSTDYRNARGIMRDVLVRMVNESYEDRLPGLRAPLEMVWGEHDAAAPLELARRAAELAPDARLTVVPGGHFAPLDQRDVLRAAVLGHRPA